MNFNEISRPNFCNYKHCKINAKYGIKKKRTPGNKNTYSNTQIYVPGMTAVNHMGGVGSHLG